MMPPEQYRGWAETHLAPRRIRLEEGLTSEEIRSVEGEYGFRFPPDLREFLEAVLPLSERFPDWRNGSKESIEDLLRRPEDGILFDIEHDGFWLDEWGPRPSSSNKAQDVAREAIRRAPKLIPIYGHRYLPALPGEAGNPAFSVQQTDVIVYGADLAAYLENEFCDAWTFPSPSEVKTIPFWSGLAMLNA